MAKNFNDNSESTNREYIVTQAEPVATTHHFSRWIAVACACVLVVGSGVYLKGLGGTKVSTNPNEGNTAGVGLSGTEVSSTSTSLFGEFNITEFSILSYYDYQTQEETLDYIALSDEDILNINASANIDGWSELDTKPSYLEDCTGNAIQSVLISFCTESNTINVWVQDNYITIDYYDRDDTSKYLYSKYYQYSDTTDTPLIDLLKSIAESNAYTSNSTTPTVKLFGEYDVSKFATAYASWYYDSQAQGDATAYYTSEELEELVTTINELSDYQNFVEVDDSVFDELGDDDITVQNYVDLDFYLSGEEFGELFMVDNYIVITTGDGAQNEGDNQHTVKTYQYKDSNDTTLFDALVSTIQEHDTSKMFGLFDYPESVQCTLTDSNSQGVSTLSATLSKDALYALDAKLRPSKYMAWTELAFDSYYESRIICDQTATFTWEDLDHNLQYEFTYYNTTDDTIQQCYVTLNIYDADTGITTTKAYTNALSEDFFDFLKQLMNG